MILDAGLRAAQAEFVQLQWGAIELPAGIPSWWAITGVNVAPVHCSDQGPLLQLVQRVQKKRKTKKCTSDRGRSSMLRSSNGSAGRSATLMEPMSLPEASVTPTALRGSNRGQVDRNHRSHVPVNENNEKELVLRTLFGEVLEEMRVVLPAEVQVLGCFGLPYRSSYTLLCVLHCQMPSNEEFQEAVRQDRGHSVMSRCLQEVGGIVSKPLIKDLLQDPHISDYVRSNTGLLLRSYNAAAATGKLTGLKRLTGKRVRLTTVPAKMRGFVFQAVKAGKLAQPSVFMGAWIPLEC